MRPLWNREVLGNIKNLVRVRSDSCLNCQMESCVGHVDHISNWRTGSTHKLTKDGERHGGTVLDCWWCTDDQVNALMSKVVSKTREKDAGYDAVEPPHYRRGPRVYLGRCNTYGELLEKARDTVQFDDRLYMDIECIDVFRAIQDPRLATAFKYIWRVAFGGKAEPWDSRDQEERDARDIKSAMWYLEDYVANPPETLADSPTTGYDQAKAAEPGDEGKR